MAKIYATFAVCLALLGTLIHAEPPHYRTLRRNGALRTNIRFLARQEEPAPVPTTAAPAPYPPAGVTPEVPFELPTETEAAPAAEPDQTYGPPDQTYGPPEEAEAPVQPNNIYGPPESAQPGAEEPETVANPDLAPQSLIQPRNGKDLRLSVVPVPQNLAPRAGLVEIIRSEPILVYTLK